MIKKYSLSLIVLLVSLIAAFISCQNNPNDPENENVPIEVLSDYTFPNSNTKVNIDRTGEGREYDDSIMITLTGVRTADTSERITSDLMQIEKGTISTASQIAMLKKILGLDYVDWDKATIEITQTIDSYNDLEGYVLEQSEETIVVIDATPKTHYFKIGIVGGNNDKTFLNYIKEKNTSGSYGAARFSENGQTLEIIKYNSEDVLYKANFDSTKSESVATYISEKYLGTTYTFEITIANDGIFYNVIDDNNGVAFPRVPSVEEISEDELEYYKSIEDTLSSVEYDNKLFFEACQYGRLATVGMILEDRAFDINVVDELGKTALMYAASSSGSKNEDEIENCSNVIAFLLYKGADITITNNDGWNVFMTAVDSGNYELVAMFIALDIDVNVVASSGADKQTALDLANLRQNSDTEDLEYSKIIALLEAAEAKTADELA